MPKVSVIVNTRNEASNIENCLHSLDRQTFRDFETIVVDNHSTDGTAAIAEGWGAKVAMGGPERSEQKNLGARLAGGAYLFFVDADMILSEGVLAEAASVFAKAAAWAALVVPELSVGNGFWARCRALEKRLYFGDELIEAPRFFRQAVFSAVGGYSPGMVAGEDWDLRDRALAAGFAIGRLRSVIYHNEGDLKLATLLRKKAFYAAHLPAYLLHNPPGPVRVFRFLFRKGFLINSRLILVDPIHFLGLIFLKTAEYAAGLFGFMGRGRR